MTAISSPAEPPESTLAAVLAEAPDRVIRKHLFTLYPEEIACDCGWVAKDPSDGRLLDLWCYHLAAILAATPTAAHVAELEAALAAAEARLRAVEALEIRALSDDFMDLIQAHNNAHAISNSPYGHVCGKKCWANTLAARAPQIILARAALTPPQPAP